MSDHRFAVKRALDRCAAARSFERRSRMNELVEASSALRQETEKLHGWLQKADDYLTSHPDLSDFTAREDRYLSELQRYSAMHSLLGQALQAIAKEAA